MQAQLAVATYYGLIKLLATCAGGSASVAETLLSGELPDTVRRLLQTSTLFSSSTTSTASVLRTNDQLLEVRGLLCRYSRDKQVSCRHQRCSAAALPALRPCCAPTTSCWRCALLVLLALCKTIPL